MTVQTAMIVLLMLASDLSTQRATLSRTRESSALTSDTASQVLAFEKAMEAAVVRGDVAYLERACARDFSFTHGDGWTRGGAPLRVENKTQWLAAVGKAPYVFRDLESVQVEVHGDVAITYGMYRARLKPTSTADRGPFTVWFERVYAYRQGRWQYLSHRTVNGPIYGS